MGHHQSPTTQIFGGVFNPCGEFAEAVGGQDHSSQWIMESGIETGQHGFALLLGDINYSTFTVSLCQRIL
jgi:hypothetical protein